jgi:quinoprotein glucose dehydrogenase
MPAISPLSDAALDFLVAYVLHPKRVRASGPEQLVQNSTGETTPNISPQKLRYRSSFGFMFASSGLPVIAPPWTTLTAYDLNCGTIDWQVPLGEVPELAAKGFKDTGSHFPKVGPVLTAGGLIFTGTRDRKVRALDSQTGRVLWEAKVDAAIEGMPAVYEIGGREYIVFCAAAQATARAHDISGHPALQVPIPGAYVAFALPEGVRSAQKHCVSRAVRLICLNK